MKQKQLEMTLFTLVKEHFPKACSPLLYKALCQGENSFPIQKKKKKKTDLNISLNPTISLSPTKEQTFQ